MWCERFSIIVLSLQRGHLPSMWHAYRPTFVDWGILLGTIGFFGLLFLLFLRWVPVIPTSRGARAEPRARRASSGARGGVEARGVTRTLRAGGRIRRRRDELLAAIARLRADGYRRLDAFVPYPVEGSRGGAGLRRSWLNWVAVAAGAVRRRLRVLAAVAGRTTALSAEHRRPALLRDPGVHHRHLRDDGPVRRGHGVRPLVLGRAGCRGWPIRCSRRRGSRRASLDRFWLGVSADDPIGSIRRADGGRAAALGAARVE